MYTQVYLSASHPPKMWEGKTISFQEDRIVLHVLRDNLQEIQQAAKKIYSEGFHKVKLVPQESWDLESCWAFYQGFFSAKQDFEIIFPELSQSATSTLNMLRECSSFLRELINTPADDLFPLNLVNKGAAFLKSQANSVQQSLLHIRILQGDELNQQGYHGTYCVGKSSSIHMPAVLEVDYNPTGNKDAEVFAALIGKGITFDSGGYSLKPSASMLNMRTDMGGSALVIAALGLAIRMGIHKRIKLYVCSAENMVSDTSMKLGDIIHYANGKTVEILNTDAEGRLVLADGLIKASLDKPKYIIDCATLTGAAKVALGNDYHALLSYDDLAVDDFLTVALNTHEPFWRLPLTKVHTEVMSSNYADIGNMASAPGGVSAGASTAAGFLANFVENHTGWLHFDLSATFRAAGSKTWSAGATGIGMRTLAAFLCK